MRGLVFRFGRMGLPGIALAGAVAGCATVIYSDQPVPRDLGADGPAEVATRVLANAGEWRNSGAVVKRGRAYRVRAEGSWQAFPGCVPTGPDGEGMYNLLCIPWTVGRVVIDRPHQALIGKIGEAGQPFAIGAAHEFTAAVDGVLYLSMNELFQGAGDNQGSVAVTVALKDAPSIGSVAAARAAPAARPSAAALAISFPKGPVHPDDVAVVIGNADYKRQGRDIPDVVPAHADAALFKRYAIESLGVREGNIIDLRDATAAQFVSVFGTKGNPKGQLFDWVRPDRSRVHVYYAGHGAPGGAEGGAYLIPVDADATRIELNGYPLATLYENLAKLPARSVTVVLEACFSGASQGGGVISNASPVFLKARTPSVPSNLTVVAAGAANQIASWEEDRSHGLFTKHFLKGMSGEADARPHGNGDGKVSPAELDAYLKDTLTYLARRYYGRDQTAEIVNAKEW